MLFINYMNNEEIMVNPFMIDHYKWWYVVKIDEIILDKFMTTKQYYKLYKKCI